ncbi:MAG: 2Fe-2S iron-sulfur cluster binding domain-containing protein [Burkholderiales bacterium]|jgi:ferredoxin|nr:2Fe-2S iron-sulfur cluster binding domain-containing protein [Burkholderiales bacterium]
MELNERFQVLLPGSNVAFKASASDTLLASAQRAGVVLTSSCRNGTCRACIARLGEGRVMYRIEWPGLSADEKAAGYFLPCVAYPASDLVVRSFGAD